MSNEPPSNGFSQIPHEIMNAAIRFLGGCCELNIVLAVAEHTFGFHREEWDFAEEFLAQLTGRHKDTIRKDLKKLIRRNIIIEVQKPTATTSRKLKINKNTTEWVNRPSGRKSRKGVGEKTHYNNIDNKINPTSTGTEAGLKEIYTASPDPTVWCSNMFFTVTQEYKAQIMEEHQVSEVKLKEVLDNITAWIQKKKPDTVVLANLINKFLTNDNKWHSRKSGPKKHKQATSVICEPAESWMDEISVK